MSSEADSRPRVVILGGCGFIGRSLVGYLVGENLASAVRVVDKTPPQTAWLNRRHAAVFESGIVEFRSANLVNPDSCAAALSASADGLGWDLAVNCAGETRCGRTDAVYGEGVLALGGNVARACLDAGVRRLVEISSGCVYRGDKNHVFIPPQTHHAEDGALEPWTAEGRWKLMLESELASLAPELRCTVLRPALVYGPADRRGLTPRLLVGGVYKYINEPMKLLWTPDLRLNTVHVLDLCRAIWWVWEREDAVGRTYNVVDEGDSTQGSVTEMIAEIFGISHEYVGTALSMLAKTDIASVADEANDKHLCAWARACAAGDVANTPLEPSTPPEMLLNCHLALDGTRLQETGFRCAVPRVTVQHLREVLEDYADMKVFPKSLLL